MKPYDAMTADELFAAAESLITRLRERLSEVPSDPDHHTEMFVWSADELKDLAAYIHRRADDMCLDRLHEPDEHYAADCRERARDVAETMRTGS